MSASVEIELRIVFTFLFIVFLFVNYRMSSIMDDQNRSNPNRLNQQENVIHPIVPVIYTFFSPRVSKQGKPDDDFHSIKQIQVWKTLWKEEGWEPRVLNLDDSKRHPDFIKYREILQNSHYSNLWDESHDSLNFYRWLAMVAQGSGGWMVDYDVIPTGMDITRGLDLPNDGKFTSYNYHVPALMSGNTEEWARVSHLVLDQVTKGERDPIEGIPNIEYSDMKAVKDLHKEDAKSLIFEDQIHVLSTYPYKVNTEDNLNIIDCEVLSRDEVWVTHLSPFSTQQAIDDHRLHSPERGRDVIYARYNYAWELYFLWKYECERGTARGP